MAGRGGPICVLFLAVVFKEDHHLTFWDLLIMKKEIRLNAFAMNCVAHQSPGLWTHPRDRTADYNRLPYWIDLAKTLERGRFDGLFLADVLGVYDVFGGSPDAALRNATQTPANRCF
jgi:hypothetical protein